MHLIKTKSFDLAAISKGDGNSKRVAICLPGRLDTKDYANFPSHLEFLASKGFYALSFDPPGTWDSPGGIEQFSTTNYIKATNELIEHFGNRETLLLGHSRGGQVAMLVGTSNPAVVGFATAMGSFGPPTPPNPDSVKDGAITEYRDLPPGDTKTTEQKKFILSMNYFKDGQQYNPVPALKECRKPKLIFYGTKDVFTEIEEVKEIFETIPEPKMIHELNCEHDYRYHPGIIEEINQIMGQFLDKYI